MSSRSKSYILPLVACAALLPFLISAKGQDSTRGDNWQRYTVKGEEFSVTLPTLPATTIRDVWIKNLNRYRREVALAAYAEGVVYIVHAFENPQKASLDDFMKQFRDPLSSASRDTTRNGFQVREYTFETEAQKGLTQYFVTNNYLYRFTAARSNLAQVDTGMEKFFSSISLDRKDQAVELTEGPGEQPEVDSSDPNSTPLTGREVDVKTRIFFKPEPRYTESARQNQVSGTVVLRVVFASSGAVTKIRATSGLPFGLTEQAIASAKQIRFLPAVKNGRFVSLWVQLEYNFTLY